VPSSSPARAYIADPYSYAEARALVEELGVSEPVAVTLVRRGHRTVEQARSFLEAADSHDPFAFEEMEAVVARLLAQAESGGRITVHGDFDVDGVCATVLLVSALRELGSDCDWYIPDRLSEGYGLSAPAMARLAARGTSLLLTADCGISAAEEVDAARGLGLEVIVTDHHAPGERLPDCPILHPRVSGYPFPELCGTGVAHKLASALRARSGGGGRDGEEADLDLVALATVADLVPLVGENRAMVRRGLGVARRGRRPGLRALIAASGANLERLDEGDLAFRIGPRINAAGRLYRADAGVELFLTRDGERAQQVAAELDRANRERQIAEREVEAAAEMALRDLPAHLRDAAAIVLGGQGWHPGVIGIVASRLVESHWRPVILVSLGPDGRGRGSGRSIPGFDLLEALRACSADLTRFGGHRAAAGLEIAPGRLDAFRDSLIEHAAASLEPEQLTRTERIDALVGGPSLGLELAEELERLAPFGMGNPGVRLLVPSATIGDVRPMGEGRHSRFSLRSGSSQALGVAFGFPSLSAGGDPVDASVRLEVNQWNGSIEPRLVLRDLYPLNSGREPGASEHAAECGCEADEWWARFEAVLEAPLGTPPAGPIASAAGRESVWRPGSAVALIAELTSSGESVLALCADASRRQQLATGAAGLARFSGGAARIACGRCSHRRMAEALGADGEGLVLADYPALGLTDPPNPGFGHVVLVDPAPSARLQAIATRAPAAGCGYLHHAWGEPERGFGLRVVEDELGLRRPLAAIFRELRESGEAAGERLRALLRGEGKHRRSPELAGRCVRVLLELGLLELPRNDGARSLGAVSSDATDLERSAAFRAYRALLEEAKAFLGRQTHP
jgi:single-stranded-DNA-specific exonuclease